MGPAKLEVVDGTAVGAWIEPALGRAAGDVAGHVTGTVPANFKAYARILHPARDQRLKPMRWEQVAAELGRTVHPLVQWDALVGANRWRSDDSPWPGYAPDEGSLPVELLDALCMVVAQHTGCAERCFFGVWTSHWDPGTSFTFSTGGSGEAAAPSRPEQPVAPFTSAELRQGLLKLPPFAGRDYRVLCGPLEVATKLPELTGLDEWVSPNMIWPADRAWYLASEIDFDSTLVGGSTPLIQTIFDAPEFEAFSVGPMDSLERDADLVNPRLPDLDENLNEARPLASDSPRKLTAAPCNMPRPRQHGGGRRDDSA